MKHTFLHSLQVLVTNAIMCMLTIQQSPLFHDLEDNEKNKKIRKKSLKVSKMEAEIRFFNGSKVEKIPMT